MLSFLIPWIIASTPPSCKRVLLVPDASSTTRAVREGYGERVVTRLMLGKHQDVVAVLEGASVGVRTVSSLRVHGLRHWLEVLRWISHKHWLRWSDIITIFFKFRRISYGSVWWKHNWIWTGQVYIIIFRNVTRKCGNELILPGLATREFRIRIVSCLSRWIVLKVNLFLLKLCFVHSWSEFVHFVRHIHCLIKCLLNRPLVNFPKLWLHKHFDCHSHTLLAVKRHSHRVLTFFLRIPHYCRIDDWNFSCLSW